MIDFEEHFSIIKDFLPKYLSPPLLEDLFLKIKEEFPLSTNQYILYDELEKDFYYQADAIIDIPFPIFDTNTGKFLTKYYSAIILSNTCDISLENKRLSDPNVLLSAIIPLQDYVQELQENNISLERIQSFEKDLRLNRISNLFYLPSIVKDGRTIFAESFLRFDFSTCLPVGFLEKYNKEYFDQGDRLFSLTNYGFYLFITKVSIHFNRIREGVFRNK